MDFSGKVALVTGAGSGIGRATALRFAEAGAKVVVADISVDGGEATVAQIRAAGGDATFVKTNVALAADVEALVTATVLTYGRLDCAFNNAGIEGTAARTTDCTEENWDRTLAVNLKGIWLCMKYEIAQMLKQGGGSIVNASSAAGLVGFFGLPAYVASKHGVIGLTKVAALEFAKKGIRVNATCPGIIETALIDRLTGGNSESTDRLIAAEPIGRMGQPAEVAECVLWLCSDAASFVTGHALSVDGGWVAQ